MARSHHRKKHKTQLKQYKHDYDASALSVASAKTKAAVIFTIIGALIGGAVGFFATNQSFLWLVIGLIPGAIAGYYIGRKIDKE